MVERQVAPAAANADWLIEVNGEVKRAPIPIAAVGGHAHAHRLRAKRMDKHATGVSDVVQGKLRHKPGGLTNRPAVERNLPAQRHAIRVIIARLHHIPKDGRAAARAGGVGHDAGGAAHRQRDRRLAGHRHDRAPCHVEIKRLAGRVDLAGWHGHLGDHRHGGDLHVAGVTKVVQAERRILPHGVRERAAIKRNRTGEHHAVEVIVANLRGVAEAQRRRAADVARKARGRANRQRQGRRAAGGGDARGVVPVHNKVKVLAREIRARQWHGDAHHRQSAISQREAARRGAAQRGGYAIAASQRIGRRRVGGAPIDDGRRPADGVQAGTAGRGAEGDAPAVHGVAAADTDHQGRRKAAVRPGGLGVAARLAQGEVPRLKGADVTRTAAGLRARHGALVIGGAGGTGINRRTTGQQRQGQTTGLRAAVLAIDAEQGQHRGGPRANQIAADPIDQPRRAVAIADKIMST